MRRSPTGDWYLPGGALAFVAVLFALAVACEAFGGVTYVDPAGWSIEAAAQVHYSSIEKFQKIEAFAPRDQFKLIREMADRPADYIECRVTVPEGESIWIGPLDSFVAVLRGDTRIRALRAISTDGMDQTRLYDSSVREFSIGGSTKIARSRGDERFVVFLHFPADSVTMDALAQLEFHSREEVVERCYGPLR